MFSVPNVLWYCWNLHAMKSYTHTHTHTPPEHIHIPPDHEHTHRHHRENEHMLRTHTCVVSAWRLNCYALCRCMCTAARFSIQVRSSAHIKKKKKKSPDTGSKYIWSEISIFVQTLDNQLFFYLPTSFHPNKGSLPPSLHLHSLLHPFSPSLPLLPPPPINESINHSTTSVRSKVV